MVLQNESKSVKGLVPGHDSGNGDSIDTDSTMDSNLNGPSDTGHHSSSGSNSSTGGGSAGGGTGAGIGSIATSNGGTVERMSHEQPVIKRQRIEHDRGRSTDGGAGGIVSAGAVNTLQHGQSSLGNSPETRANGMPTTSTTPASSSGNSSNASSACSSSTSLSSSPSCSSTKLVPSSLDHSSDDEQQQHSAKLVAHAEQSTEDYHAVFQEAIGRQCLCTIDSSVLLLSFKAHRIYTHTVVQSDGIGDTAPPLSEWPFEHLLKFLSNVQLLFDTYLKQNIKGNICAGVMELCNYLIRSDDHPHLQHPHLRMYRVNSPTFAGFPALDIDELIGLCSCNNKYVSYLAGRILSSFLIIVKDDPDDDRWLEKIVANLFDFGHLDLHAVRKINASLEVIKRIVEWKDETEHPLEEEAAGGAAVGAGGGGPGEWHSPGGGSSSATGGGAVGGAPSLADNYFATHYASHQYANDEGASRNIFHSAGGMSDESSATASSSTSGTALSSATKASEPPAASSHGTISTTHQLLSGGEGSGPCRYITLTDSESFDTTRIKFETINILGGKWSALVKHISSLIRAQANSSNPAVMVATETCILTFLRLWESIISVKANLSVVETQPFHSQLDSFQLLLLVTKNAVIYRQMLTLFNEALCYGSTLALQDLIPEEVGSLAHNIVRSVKDYRILDKMPKSSYSNHLGFLGYQGEIVRYQNRRLARLHESVSGVGSASHQQPPVVASPETCYDRTLLQKMALLVLKAVAVIVKEIRCDSSDSSVDSSDFDMQEIQMIERSIRDVVKKLETFLKAQLEFHPESHFSKVLIHLFDDQDDYLVEAMVCTLDVTSGISFRNNAFPELIAMLNPVYTFIEFSNLGPNITHLFLDLLISPETCFLLFLLRFLKYIRQNWAMFTQSCYNYYRHNSYSNAATLLQHRLRAATGSNAGLVPGGSVGSGSSHGGDHSNAAAAAGGTNANVILDSVMTVLISLRLQISRLVADTLFPYNITPILRLIENCESLYEGNELS
ncbi:protein lines [Anopheles marshallii]|uniref:protein lines n=1 Tax=Anopheles marshallii TaxID=1521116 RepID=UPI00237ADE18|nr:protein lines [Anopheles marshallii]